MSKKIAKVSPIKAPENPNAQPGFCSDTSQIQLRYGIFVNMIVLGVGMASGLATVQVPQLTCPDSEIPITKTDAAWIASVLPLFSAVGCLISGYLADNFGRRFTLIICQIPTFFGWLYTSLAKSPRHIIIGRALTGIGCGMSMGPPRIYTTEICLPNMRGMIGAFPVVFFSLGLTVEAGLGKFLDWRELCYISCVFTFSMFCLLFFLPESPYYVLKTKSVLDARKKLAKFRGRQYDLDKEIEQLVEFKRQNDIRNLTTAEVIQILFSNSSCKPAALIFTYVIIAQASGVTCVYTWSIVMLTLANSSFDPHTGNVLTGATRLVMGIITSILIYRVGRRPLSLISAFGVACVSLALGLFVMYYKDPSVIPLLFMLLYLAFASLGYYPLPFLMGSELYPLQVRGILSGASVSLHCLMMFASINICQHMMDSLGLDWTFIIFGMISLLGTLFFFLYLPETKDLTLQEIEDYYREIRPTMGSQRRLMSLTRLQTNDDEYILKPRDDLGVSKNTGVVKLEEPTLPGSPLGPSVSHTNLASPKSISLMALQNVRQPSVADLRAVSQIALEKPDLHRDASAINLSKTPSKAKKTRSVQFIEKEEQEKKKGEKSKEEKKVENKEEVRDDEDKYKPSTSKEHSNKK